MTDTVNQDVVLPETGAGIMIRVERYREPLRSLHPFELSNKPQMIDPAVNLLQLCMIDRNDVIGQCNSPIDENDYHGWQRVIHFFRTVVSMAKPVHPQLCFMHKGDVIGESFNVPDNATDMNAWQKDMIQLRLRVGVMRLEHLL